MTPAPDEVNLGFSVVRLLVVEDDAGIAQPLVKGLAKEGFAVEHVTTGAAALASPPVDVVLLDLRLPDIDGLDVCRALRKRSTVPIIIFSARTAEADRVAGLELGADDYIPKPFGMSELIARIRAVLRRVAMPNEETEVQFLDEIVIDRRRRKISVAGTEVVLTAKEFDLVAALAADPGAVVTREKLIADVWDVNWYGPTKTLDVHVSTLRQKLGDPDLIETVRGVGYRLNVGD
jgi:two-component system response regulator RegX3